ncbi:MAG: helix-turn-helix transcriptional regulator [Spirochaetaceae bacterium]|nr:helix-turn-helix transcriptional regulator [Spirochaetaceae bacterium]
MKDELQSMISAMPTEKLFLTYMNLISQCEGEEVYRMIEPVGDGIMKHTHIAKGIELVYSELEFYSPNFQAEKKEIDGIEIMYIVEGHSEFELRNRHFASGAKGDIMIFNSRTAVKKAMLGKSGMNCISLILFTKDAIAFLNDFFDTTEFTEKSFFSEIRKSDCVFTISGNDLLEKLFLEMMRFPDEFSKYEVRLAVVHAVLLLMQKLERNDRHEKRDAADLYFSGTTGHKVQNARRIINANLEKEISIEELAQKVNLNRTTLQKIFKEMYGLTVNEYRTKSRIQLAKNLLASTDLSITEIAGRCGYANASKFSEVFKKNEGALPKDWRK